jgi:L-ascorbate metabolism protein UlaG (beta-lactamase superfamily)
MKKILIVTALLLSLLLAACSTQEEKVVSVDSKKDTATEIQFIRNATMKISYAGKTFLTDPMLSEKESLPGFLNNAELSNPTADLPVSVEEILADVETIFVTHTHIPAEDVPAGPSDHFDSAAIENISKDMPIYIQPFDAAGIRRVGFNDVTAIEDSIVIDGIKVTRFEGVHADVDALLPIVGESSGYVFEADGYPTVLWTGDVLLTDEIKEVIKKHSPDIIIAHTGGAQLPIDNQGNVSKLVMDAEDAIEIANIAPQAKIIAIHMESLDHCPVTREGLREKANEAGISEDRLIIPEDGETIKF